jgi:hypothetical protein
VLSKTSLDSGKSGELQLSLRESRAFAEILAIQKALGIGELILSPLIIRLIPADLRFRYPSTLHSQSSHHRLILDEKISACSATR